MTWRPRRRGSTAQKRLTGAQVLDAAANGLPIVGNGSSDPHVFFDKLDELLASVPGLDGSTARCTRTLR